MIYSAANQKKKKRKEIALHMNTLFEQLSARADQLTSV